MQKGRISLQLNIFFKLLSFQYTDGKLSESRRLVVEVSRQVECDDIVLCAELEGEVGELSRGWRIEMKENCENNFPFHTFAF
jgi:hypothetical protein